MTVKFSLKKWAFLLGLGFSGATFAATNTALPNVELTGQLLYQIMASEIALQRNEPALAYQTYMQMARSTKDPRLAQRAFQIADTVHAFADAQKAGELWTELAPGNADAQLADLLAAIRTGQMTPEIRKEAEKIIQSATTKEKRQQFFQAITIQADLSGAPAAKVLEFIRPLALLLKDREQAALALAKLYRVTGDTKQGAAFALKAYQQMPDNTAALLEYADSLLKAQPGKATSEIEKFVKKHPDDMQAQLALAKAYAHQKNVQGIQKQLRILEPFAERSGALAYTLASVTDAARMDNDTKRLLLLFERLAQGDSSLSERLPQTHLSLGLLDFRQKHFEAAINWLSKVPAKSDFYTQARLLQAQALVELNRSKEAIHLLDKTVVKNKDAQAELLHKKAQILYASGKLRESYSAMRDALDKAPESPALLYQCALLAVEDKQYKDAERFLRKAIDLYPDRADFYNTLGYLWVEQNTKLDEAQAMLEKALSLDPENAAILDSIGWLHFKLGNYAQAQSYLEKAAQRYKDREILLHLAELYHAQGQTSKAMAILRPMLQAAPNDATLDAFMERLHLHF